MQSSNLDKIYHDTLSAARLTPKPGILEPGRIEDLVVAYTPRSEPAARILYTGILHSGGRAILAPLSEAATSIVPYKEPGGLLVLHDDPRSLRLVTLSEAAGLLGVETVVVGRRLHPAVEERLEASGAEIVEVEAPAPILALAAIALYWAPKLMGAREARYREELEHLETALEWVEERLPHARTPPTGDSITIASYTPLAKPGAVYHHVLEGGPPPVPLESLPDLRLPRTFKTSTIVYTTGVEEFNYKDILVRLGLRGPKPLLIRIDTDPVTAGFYSMLAAGLLAGKLA